MELIKVILSEENLDEALRRVKVNKGAPGIDEMPVSKLDEYFKAHKDEGYISKMVNSRNRINEKIIFLHVSNTEEICDLMHSFLD